MPEGISVAHGPEQGAADILKDTHFGENIGYLKTAGKAAAIDLMGRPVGDVTPIQLDLTGTHRIKPADQVKQSGFAGAVGSDDGMTFTAANLQINPIDDFAAAETFMHIGQLEGHGRHYEDPFFISKPLLPASSR